jgi:hypothetical protein
MVDEKLSTFLQVAEIISFSSLQAKIIEVMPPSQTLSENLKLLSFFNPSFSHSFANPISFLSQKLSEVSVDDLSSLSVHALHQVFSSSNLPSDSLFELTTKLISTDSSFTALLPIVNFKEVSSSSVHSFFENFSFDQLFPDLWESLKPRLYLENADPFSREQIIKIIEKVNSISQEDCHPFDKIMKCFSDLEFFKKVYLFIPKPDSSYQGIIHKLKELSKGDISKEISITASSVISNKPEVMFTWDGEY